MFANPLSDIRLKSWPLFAEELLSLHQLLEPPFFRLFFPNRKYLLILFCLQVRWVRWWDCEAFSLPAKKRNSPKTWLSYHTERPRSERVVPHVEKSNLGLFNRQNTVKSRFNELSPSAHFLKSRLYVKSRLFNGKYNFGHKILSLKLRCVR